MIYLILKYNYKDFY